MCAPGSESCSLDTTAGISGPSSTLGAPAPGLTPMADDLACGGVSPADRRAEGHEVHGALLDLGDLAPDTGPPLDRGLDDIARRDWI